MNVVMHAGKDLGTALVCAAAFVVILLPGSIPALAAAVEVDAGSAHHAVWRVNVEGRPLGTAFAIGERLFLTCEHVFRKSYGKKVFLDQRGSEHSRKLWINRDHVALAAAEDIASFATTETVDHYLALADTSSTEPETGLIIMGHPQGRPLVTLRNTDPIGYQNELHFAVAADGLSLPGFSGSPLFRDNGKVVGLHCHGNVNMFHAVKVEQLHRFLNGELAGTACRDDLSLAACIELATKQLREFAEAGDPEAQFQLSFVGKDRDMLNRSAEAGYAIAQHKRGLLLEDDAEEHFRAHREAKAHEHWAEASKWYRRSAEQGFPLAKTDLADLLYEGKGVFRDVGRAFRLLLEGARAGDADAHHQLGVMYERGHGTARDETIARRWFQGAIDRGNRDASWRLEELLTTRAMRVVGRAEAHAAPVPNSEITDSLRAGSWVRVLERTGNWFKLTPKLGYRFVHASKLAEVGPSEVAPLDPEISPPPRRSGPHP